ncbi:hypothetical protein Tco_1563600 [Tanacetum coccineum]|uniref:Uncharacterized protein n=1 Tax=Tanacetum coccineum TaxID=301880 RepID=A0ABQ4XVL3_9ASTR
MTRSSTSELFTPYKEPEREFRSSRRHFKTLSLDELRSPDFNLFSDQEYSEEEEAETMAETMKQTLDEVSSTLFNGDAGALTDVAIRNQGASIKTLEIQIGQMSKVLQERGFGCLPRSTEANPRDQVKSISTTIEADSCLIRRIGSYQYDVSTGHSRTLMYEANNDEFRSNIV